MIKNKKIIAIIPARGGSKGIKLKNLRKIKGKTLVTIVGNLVSKIKVIDQAVISTDHKKIANYAIKSGLKFYSFRPKNISGDKISDTAVILHALTEAEKIEKIKYDIVVMLHPTSPLRKIKDIIGSINLLIKKKYDSVWTVSKTDSKYHPLKQLLITNNKLDYYSKKGSLVIARQQLSDVYYRNSAAYVIKADFLRKNKKIIGKNSGAYIINNKQISIDTIEDINEAKKLYKK
ncbi:acylneuraminate cytidylyltransferase family protein [Candidatus Pelagibacter ubique]|nr:acylneuraminate cytidylyltransferase family protein [Candidatus Pelagibacter ubique]